MQYGPFKSLYLLSLLLRSTAVDYTEAIHSIHAIVHDELSVFPIFAVLFVVNWESAVQFQVQFLTVALLLRISKDFIRFHS